MLSSSLKNSRFQLSIAVLLGATVLVAAGCSGDGASPTEPASAEFTLTSAQVIVGSQSVNGQILPEGHGEGESTRFEAHLMAPDSQAAGATVWMEFDRPRGMGMGHHVGRIQLYDDGTHGDAVAGDGVYCFEDVVGDYGCHGGDAGPGEYHYEFFAEHRDGHETNHMLVTVTITDS